MCLGRGIFLFWSYYLCIFDEIFKRNCFAFDRTTCIFNNPKYSIYYSIIYDALWTILSIRNLFYFRSYQSPNNLKYTVSSKRCDCIFYFYYIIHHAFWINLSVRNRFTNDHIKLPIVWTVTLPWTCHFYYFSLWYYLRRISVKNSSTHFQVL